MPSPAKPMARSTAFCNARTDRQSKQKLKSHSKQPSHYTTVIFSQTFTKIATFIAYLQHSCNAEPKITAAKPTTNDADWLVWLAQPISDGAGSHVTTSSLFGRWISRTMPRRVPGAWKRFCFFSVAVRRRRWTILSHFLLQEYVLYKSEIIE